MLGHRIRPPPSKTPSWSVIFRPSGATFYLSFENALGVADAVIPFGEGSWLPAAGDLIPQNPGDSKSCSDFGSSAEVAAWFDYYFHWYGDVANLDADDDGIPCEGL